MGSVPIFSVILGHYEFVFSFVIARTTRRIFKAAPLKRHPKSGEAIHDLPAFAGEA